MACLPTPAPVTQRQQPQSHQLHGPGSKAQQAKDQQRPGLKTKPQQAPTVKPRQAQDPAAQAAEKSFAQLSKDKRPSQTDVTPYVELYLNQRPQQHAVDLTEVNALTQTLLELAEETEIKLILCRSLLTVCWHQAREKRAMSFGPW